MFCPNCGTKNDHSAVKCSQCGFDQRKTGTPKFKGTMMLEGPPRAHPGVPAPTAKSDASKPRSTHANMKGTMVGLAPPGMEELKRQAEANRAAGKLPKDLPAKTAEGPGQQAKTSRPNMKGTMVGVAPPSLEALREQAAVSSARTPSTSATPARPRPNLKGTMVGLAPPAVEELRKQAAQAVQDKQLATETGAGKRSTANMKGTMIGVAPPDMAAELEKAKGEILARRAAASEEKAIVAVPPKASPANNSEDQTRASKLKGTMMGVAPPDMQKQLAEARAEFDVQLKKNKEDKEDSAPKPASEPNPLAGTVVGTSPFATPPSSMMTGAPTSGFDEDTPAAPAGAQEAARASSTPPANAFTHGSTTHMSATAPTAPIPERVRPSDFPGPVESRKHLSAPEQEDSPTRAVAILLALLVMVAIGVVVLLRMRGEAASAEAPADEPKPALTDGK